MLNIKGAYVVIGTAEPFAVLLGADDDELFNRRIGIVGYAKTIAFTFGPTATNAVPCTLPAMESMALEFRGDHEAKVRQLCARIALGEPIGDGKDYGDQGGQPAVIDKPKPNPKSPAGAKVARVAA